MRYERIAINGENTQAGRPRLDAYLLDTPDVNPNFKTRPAIIICPGGGYEYVSEREGEPVAMRFLAAGFHAFVLRYSVAPASFPTAVLELAEAVKAVRERAAEWKIADGRIFILGFSAGGHLCGTLGTLWNHSLFERALGPAPEPKPWKPDGMLLCYPVITMGEFTHAGSRANLLGEQLSGEMLPLLSLETQVNETTVPAFLWHTADDGVVPVENTLQYAAALRRAGVPFELHIYQTGPHGLSLCDETTATGAQHIAPDAAGWIDLAIAWVKRQGS